MFSGRAGYLKAINGAQDIKALNAQVAYFKEDLAALEENKDSGAQIEANYAQASAEQKQRIAAASYNFALGVYRNVHLSQQAPQVVDSIKTNPRLLPQAAELIGLQAKSTVQMAGSVRKIMTAAKIGGAGRSGEHEAGGGGVVGGVAAVALADQ
jgi:hypothetical protein